MTRKDYVAIADAFRQNRLVPIEYPTAYERERDEAYNSAWNRLRESIGTVFAIDNPRFDRQRFYAACEGR